MNTKMLWYTCKGNELSKLIFGNMSASGEPQYTAESPRAGGGDVVVGYELDDANPRAATPALFVVNDEEYFDLFSWITTYTPEFFPLSQFARVIAESDSRNYRDFAFSSVETKSDYHQWASIVIGELLAQGGNEGDLNSIPYSRSTACFSMSLARTNLIHATDGATSTAIQRLRKISDDPRFVKRNVSIADLEPVWDILYKFPYNVKAENFLAVIDFVVKAASRMSSGISKSMVRLLDLNNFPGLLSPSAEERVVGYQKLISEIKMLDASPRDAFVNATVAGAAFLVGRSTSHVFLLRRVADVFPAASLWFSLIAGLSGSNSWDPYWTRASKGIEKLLRQRFEWPEPALADLSWIEYSWMHAVFDGPQMFESLARMNAKVLSIEVMPGAICQIRLSGGTDEAHDLDSKKAKFLVASTREKEYESSLKEFLTLARRIERSFSTNKQAGEAVRDSTPQLFDDPQLSSKPPRKRRIPSYDR